MQGKKKIVIGALCALVMIMAVGYALLSQQLQITGQANITSNWQVEITDIKEVENIGSGRTISTNYTATTATFNNEVIHTGDKITYEITVTNKGTLDAVLENYTIDNGDNDAIIVTTDKGKEFYKGLKLQKSGGTNKITVSVQYNPNTTTQPETTSNMVSITLNYQQALGQIDTYDYRIGDKITFAGSDWYVIKHSSDKEDYVTLMKEKVLTNAELGSYAYNSTSATMEFTWTETCHNSNHGYSSSSYNCDNTNSYANSKVKEFLEGTYINTLGENKLKEVDGYKIRLITLEELQQNLGVSTTMNASWYDVDTSDSLKWVYQNFGENQNNVSGYWTMTAHPDYSSSVWYVHNRGQVYSDEVHNNYNGVRPVINLYKSEID